MKPEDRYLKRLEQLMADLEGESDRAVVIITTAHIDELMEQILRTYLVPSSQSSDPLLDSASSPFSSLAIKVDMAFRLGLISAQLANALHLVRKVRNKFAHNIGSCSLSDHDVRSRTLEISRLMNVGKRFPEAYEKMEAKKPGGILLLYLLAILATLEVVAAGIVPRAIAKPEAFFGPFD